MNEPKKRYLIIIVCLLVLVGAWFVIQKNNTEKRTPPPRISVPAGSVNGEDLSNMIQVYNPFAGAVIMPGVTIVGKARGNWFFEASAPVSIVSQKGEVLVSFPLTAQGEWMTTDFVPFTATVPQFDTKGATSGLMVFHNDNPAGNEGKDHSMSVPVRFVDANETGVRIYMGNTKLDPQMMNCTKVYAVGRIFPKTTEVGKSALTALLDAPSLFEKTGGFVSSVQYGSLNSLIIKNGEAKVDFSGLTGGGSCKVGQIKAQIEQTLKQFPTVKTVTITVDGKKDVLEP